jgi:YD repeat-containing protein
LVSYTDDFGNQVTYSYDENGLLASMTLPGNKKVTYQYDRSNRLSRVIDWAGNNAIYRYDAFGAPVSVSIPDGPVTVYQYDGAHRLRAIIGTGPDGAPVAAYRYTLDPAGNRISVAALDPAGAISPRSPVKLAFDAANRPVSDSTGQTFRYNTAGNLVAIEGPQPLALGYDAIGRLRSVQGPQSVTYGYDSSGLRTLRSGDSGERRYVYDLAARQPRMIAEMDESNTPVAWYIYGLGLLWKVAADGTAYFYEFDGDGNVVAMSNPASGVVNTYHYDAAGRLDVSNETVKNPFHARGEIGWIDDGNGLLYTGAAFQFSQLRLTLPATADPTPPTPFLVPSLSGAGACFLEGVGTCAFAAARRER